MDTFSSRAVIARARRIIGLHPVAFVALAAIIAAMPMLLALSLRAAGLIDPQFAASLGDPEASSHSLPVFLFGSLLSMPTLLGNIVLDGGIASATWREVEGRAPDLGADLRRGAALLPPLLALSVLSYAGIAIGLVLLFVPGIILALMWFVVLPACAVERSGLAAAFGRSRALTVGHRSPILGFLVLYALVYGAMIFLGWANSRLLASLGTSGSSLTLAYGLQVVEAAAWGLFDVVSAAGTSAIYVELRRAKDGYLSRDLVDVFA